MRPALGISVVVLTLATSTLPAQIVPERGSATIAMVPAKSPTTARLIGIMLPGAGHVYAGEPGRGFAYFGGTLGLFVIGTMRLASDCAHDMFEIEPEECGSDVGTGVVAVAAVGLWGGASTTRDARRVAPTSTARCGRL